MINHRDTRNTESGNAGNALSLMFVVVVRARELKPGQVLAAGPFPFSLSTVVKVAGKPIVSNCLTIRRVADPSVDPRLSFSVTKDFCLVVQ